ncbi:unnamed protein product [Bemisia tabaci]|uniref:Ionotropic receptor n=1 Tax=Bemisia tabaci TaxID=7038 RepID=A0A9P0AJ07_BEMTA|nr:unnamed protein product [Bemisia tabaci]
MYRSLKLYFYVSVSIDVIFLTSGALYMPDSKAEEHNLLSALTLCKRTTALSGKALFYVISIRTDFPIHTLIQNLHEGMIETVIVTHHSLLKHSIVGSMTKNIFIFLNDLDEIPSFILDSSLTFDDIVDLAPRKMAKLNRYCLQNDEHDPVLTDVNKTCDFELRLSQSVLRGECDLTDPIYDHTKGLFANRVWNSRNYITFILPTVKKGRDSIASIEKEGSPRLELLFKFFWRFFKGLRTVICFDHTCFKYDPFSDLISQVDITSGNYFTFVPDLRGKIISIGYVAKDGVFKAGRNLSPTSDILIGQAVEDTVGKLKVYIHIRGRWKELFSRPESRIDYFEDAQGSNLDMLIFDGSISPNEDFSMFDFSTAIQSFSYCFATPRSSFVPQSFLPFICFSPQTWFLILITTLSLYAAFYAFHRSQWMLFNGLYSEIEQRAFADTPVSFYLYSFLVVGSPSRLLLGRVATGKILFLIVSLFVLVIITVYQSEMTTLLAKEVRYPDIDTLEDLKNSDLLIQTPDLEASLQLLQDHPFYEDFKAKLSEGEYFYQSQLFRSLKYSWSNDTEITFNISQANLDPLARRFIDWRSNFRSIVESNAIELAVSNLHYKFRGNIRVENLMLPEDFSEFHLVKECMLTYPMTLQIQKNSYLSDILIKLIEAYVETGLIQKFVADSTFLVLLIACL